MKRLLTALFVPGVASLAAACSLPGLPAPAGTSTPVPEAAPSLPAPGGPLPNGASQPEAMPPPGPDFPSTSFQPTLIRLTEPGCCIGATWSVEGDQVLFIDRPRPDAPTGIYGVRINGGEVQLVSERVGEFSPDGRYLLSVNARSQPIIYDLVSGGTTVIRNKGRGVIFSPNSQRLAWSYVQEAQVFSERRSTITVADLDGENAREVAAVIGSGLAGWLDDDHLLLIGREEGDPRDEEGLFSLSVVDGSRVDLARRSRVHSVMPAPGGEWACYVAALDPDDPTQNGLWVVKADASQYYRVDLFGGVQWRDATHLLIIPMEINAPSHWLVQFDVTTGMLTPLTDPARFPFRIFAGEWRVSPTGHYVVFVSAEDQALWAFDLPPLESSSPSE